MKRSRGTKRITSYTRSIYTKLKRVNRKPITATEEDLDDNNRARSAKLRVAEILK